MAKFCSSCGFNVGENDKFCPECGAKLRTREEMQQCDHYCSECGTPIVTRTAEAVYKPTSAPAPSKPSKAVAGKAAAPEKEENIADEEPSSGGVSGCSVFFWLLVLAGIIYGCYYYIYMPYIESKRQEPGFTYGYGSTSISEQPNASRSEGGAAQIDKFSDAPDGDAPPSKSLDETQSLNGKVDTSVSDNTEPKAGSGVVVTDSNTAEAKTPLPYPNTQFGPQPITPQHQIELLNFIWGPSEKQNGGTIIGPFRDKPKVIILAQGEILNISREALPTVTAVVTFFDVEGNELARESVVVNRLPIYSGEAERFYVEANFNSRMYKAKVELRDPRGIPYLVKKEPDYSIRVVQ